MVNMQQLQSYSFSLEYNAYEKSTFQAQFTNDKDELITTTVQSEKYQTYKLDIQLFTVKNVNGQANGLKKFNPARIEAHTQKTDLEDIFGKDGYWGVEKTAGRIVDFVFSGAGDNLSKLQQGREGVLKGLKEAEKVFGGKLPDISYDTVQKALDEIDKKIADLNGNIIDVAA